MDIGYSNVKISKSGMKIQGKKQKKNILNILQSLNIEYHQPDGYSIFSIEYNIEYPISLLLQSGDKPSLCTSPDQGYNHTGVQYKINMDLFLS